MIANANRKRKIKSPGANKKGAQINALLHLYDQSEAQY
jgi:hypothetical protein